MSDIRIQITDFLKAAGPSAPRAIHDKLGGSESALKTALRGMAKAKELVAAGSTVSRTYALPGQKADAASAPPRRGKKAKKGKPAKKRRTQRAPRATAPEASPFLASITADSRIVINTGATPPTVYTREQSLDIAQLAAANFA
jgi:hypothetical protein